MSNCQKNETKKLSDSNMKIDVSNFDICSQIFLTHSETESNMKIDI